MAGDIRYDITVGVDAALKNVSALSNKLQQIGDDFEEITNTARNAAGVLTAVLGGLITSAANFADQLSDVAAANETTIGSVLGLASALQGAGGDADSVGRLFQTLSNQIDAANSGNLKLVDTFGKMGISIQDLGTMSNDQIRNNIIQALAAIPDAAERAAKAQEMFGKAAVGVDWKQLAADIDENTSKYAQYESNIKLAADAFDAMAAILKDIKIAATVAFEPLFRYVKSLKPEMDVLVTTIRLLAAGLGLAVGASVLGGFAKLITLVKTLTLVARANPIIAIASAVLGIAGAMGVWDQATASVEESQAGVTNETDKTVEKVQEVKRDQTGIFEAIKKQKDTLSQVTEQFDRQLQNIKDKVKFEGEALQLSEDQRKIAEQTNAIEQQTQNALMSLKQKFEALDAPARKARQGDYEKERALIEANGAAAIKTVETQLRKNQEYVNNLRNLTNAMAAMNTGREQLFDIQSRNQIAISGTQERIALEEKYNAIIRIRQALTNATAGLSEEERKRAIQAISISTTRIQNLGTEYDKLNTSIESMIQGLVKQGSISQETADRIIQNSKNERDSVITSSQEILKTNQEIADQSRTFSFGWSSAFREYVDNATNAAQAAQRVFQRATQGMEDLIVNFVKTGKLEWKGFINSMLEELLRSQIRQVMAQILTIPMAGGRSSNAAGSFFGSLLGFANGGIIPTNEPVIVGERGPELLSGASGRTVIPNEKLGQSNYVTYNINAVDASSFKSLVAADPSFIHAVAMQGARATPGRR